MRTFPVLRASLVCVSLGAFPAFVACSDNDDDGEDVCEDEIVTRLDEEANFSGYETFAVAQPGDNLGLGGGGGAGGTDIPEEVQANLKVANDAAAAELEARGLTEVDPESETPDLWIFSAAATETEEGIYWACVPGWYWWGWYYYWDPCAWLAPITFEYTEGAFLVGVADSATEEPVFGGVAAGIVECTGEAELDSRITAAVEEIFADYPEP